MYHLVCSASNSHLYKKTSHLVRTPITFNLSPDRMSVYQVAGEYTPNNYPCGGFSDQSTYDNVWGMGYACLNAFLTHSHPLQIWRSVNQSHLPETVWYQGAYSTSGKTAAKTLENCEAYLQLSAYHFSLPPKMAASGASITSAKVKFVNGGAIRCFQSAATGSTKNRMLKGVFSFDTWNMPFHVLPSISASTTPQQIAQAASDVGPDLLADSGTPRGGRDLWDFAALGQNRPDGGIPVLTSPPTKQYTMGANTLAVFKQNAGCWIVPFINAEVYGTRNYRPYFVTNTNGEWACMSVWGLSMQVTIE